MKSQFSLLTQQRFLPFFITQFLGAFNDNFFKTLVSVMIAYGLLDIGASAPGMLLALAAGLFVVPFILFTPLAGDLADKYDKAVMMRILKLTEMGIVAGCLVGLYLGSLIALLFLVFALGVQSAFFSPAKFAIMPQHLARQELIGGNALVNTGTYLAILLGTILGSVLAVHQLSLIMAALLLVLCAALGYVASRYVPAAPPASPGLVLRFNVFFEAVQILIYAFKAPGRVFPAMLCVSWFFFVGALYLSQFPHYTSNILGANHYVLTFFMTVFSMGIACGGLLNNGILKSEVSARLVPWAAVLMALFSIDLFFASQPYADVPEAVRARQFLSLDSFLSHISGWRIALDLFVIALAGGLYAVPLKAWIQDRTPGAHCARVMAGSALMDALFVLLSALTAMLVFALGFNVTHLFFIAAVGSLGFAAFAAYTFLERFAKIRGV